MEASGGRGEATQIELTDEQRAALAQTFGEELAARIRAIVVEEVEGEYVSTLRLN
jgi:hypothetical protein